jgi:hypothetical protein
MDLAIVERTQNTEGTAGTVLVATALALALSLTSYTAATDDDCIAHIDTDHTPETAIPNPVIAGGVVSPGTARAASDLLDEWLNEPPDYDRDTWTEVAAALDEHRTSHRKLFG